MTTQVYGRTRTQIMASVLANLSAGRVVTANGAGSTTTFKITQANAAADDWKGARLLFLTGANTTGYAEVTASSTPSSGIVTLTFSPAATSTTNADTAFLTMWQGQSFPIENLREYLNNAIQDCAGRFYHPVESLALHSDGRTMRFDIPSTITMVKQVQYRELVDSIQIHACDAALDEQTISGVTSALDQQDKRQGAGSAKLTIGTFTTGIVASKAISSLNLSAYDTIEFWAKSSTTKVAGDFAIVLDDTALAGSPLETLAIPALTAGIWTYCRVALATPWLDSAIISVGVKAVNDTAANILWIDDIKVVVDGSAVWNTLDRQSWRIDKEARDLVLSGDRMGYRLLKLVGGDRPALFAADSDVSEVPEPYLIAKGTAMMLAAGIGGPPSMDAEVRSRLLGMWMKKADDELTALTNLTNVREAA